MEQTKMKELSMGSWDEFIEIQKYNTEEKMYLDSIKEKYAHLHENKDYKGMIELLEDELINSRNLSKKLEVHLKYLIGWCYEGLGETSEKELPIKRAEFYERAIAWYQAMDEAAGFLISCERQMEACGGVAHYRKVAGLNDKKTKKFEKRRENLLEICFGEGVMVIACEEDLHKLIEEILKRKKVSKG